MDYAGKAAYRGEVAARYDCDRVGEPLWAVEQDYVTEWVRRMPRGGLVLDLPVGTGRFVETMLEHGMRVRGIDISADMLAEVRKRPAGADPNLLLELGDAERIGLGDEAVDYVVSWRFLHLLPMPIVGRVMSEFRRVCRKEIVVQVPSVRCGWRASAAAAILRRVLRPLRAWRNARTTPWSHIPSYVHGEPQLLACFERSGLRVVEVKTLAIYDGLPVRVYRLTSVVR